MAMVKFLTIDHGSNSRVSLSWSVPYPPPPLIKVMWDELEVSDWGLRDEKQGNVMNLVKSETQGNTANLIKREAVLILSSTLALNRGLYPFPDRHLDVVCVVTSNTHVRYTCFGSTRFDTGTEPLIGRDCRLDEVNRGSNVREYYRDQGSTRCSICCRNITTNQPISNTREASP